ncbi:MAG: hypothetical protein C7B43_21545 [Sulfobacillus benefaciens]|uniref:Uncharacterized protein n=1 Tax=Sulfobacillus benefaciens TaxID=453960 RepID=A0A2T2WFQ6_9FIRM|nr:MAG: hypothetical protein C7B43_21545 [Sulfobacillus benefaciens]HBQ93792.1 hypothetical protein [Sulfobacillus sp.]
MKVKVKIWSIATIISLLSLSLVVIPSYAQSIQKAVQYPQPRLASSRPSPTLQKGQAQTVVATFNVTNGRVSGVNADGVIATSSIIDNGIRIPPQVALPGQNCTVWAYLYTIAANPHELEILAGSVTNNADEGWIWQNIQGNWTLSYLFDRTWHVSYRGSYPSVNLFAKTWEPEPKYLYNLANGSYQLSVSVSGTQINDLILVTRSGSGTSYADQQIS